ncbi:Uncharacterized protein dnm_094820 [Desulfonema magnum]|uniref:Uncharacterized protein n=1 Tax=Desulfonema magnum TaxID=45655 RepID=A0A975BX39_9BACT|nr:Uncharacterized protein dnm_094820 [Desulfonema magnum]
MQTRAETPPAEPVGTPPAEPFALFCNEFITVPGRKPRF